MDSSEEERGRLETALNESDVVGVRLAESGTDVDVLLHVLSLPPDGPLDPDARRILRLRDVSEIRVLLRSELIDSRVAGQPAIPLADLAAVETFFSSLAWGGSIYGWRFFDQPTLTQDWPSAPSLAVALSPTSAAHTFYWFNECGTRHGDDASSYVIEGTVTFDDVQILSAAGDAIALADFVADGERQWAAVFAHDDRLSSAAQTAAQQGTPKWRDWAVVR